MAASTTRIALAGVFRKRLTNCSSASGDSHHHSHTLAVASRFPAIMRGVPPRRNVHTSWYDKDVEDGMSPAVVPDHVIQSGSDGNCSWVPHPGTGVFGPASCSSGTSPPAANGSTSVLDQTVWFRCCMEDVDKDAYL